MPLPPPPLPPRLADPTPAVFVGTGIWLAAMLVIGALSLFADRPVGVAFWTAVCGFLLGLLGYSLFRWQRSAARRGSRSAQQGLTTPN